MEPSVRAALDAALAQILPGCDVFDLCKIAGDASGRIYYRLTFKSGAPMPSLVVMSFAPADAFKSNEVQVPGPKRNAFLDVGAYLARRELPVPAIYLADLDHGLILLEDLGDTQLFDVVKHAAPGEREAAYREAIDLWIRWLLATGRSDDRDCLAFTRRFDRELLSWECWHYVEWGIEALYGVQLCPAEKAAIKRHFARLVEELEAAPTVLVHRDYQSRNLMRHRGALAIIDFQDALIGPLPYDLVALLRDSYVTLPPAELSRLIAYAHGELQRHGLCTLDEAAFTALFHAQTLQRKLKDAGRFVFIDRVKRNPWFLQHIPASLARVRAAFSKRPDYADLQDLLGRYEERLLP